MVKWLMMFYLDVRHKTWRAVGLLITIEQTREHVRFGDCFPASHAHINKRRLKSKGMMPCYVFL